MTPEKASRRHDERAASAALDVYSPNWTKIGEAIVDIDNGWTALDFVAALKNQSAAAWVAVKAIIVNPVLNEKSIKAIIREKRFEEDEVFEGAGR